jgi:hypothetical protein
MAIKKVLIIPSWYYTAEEPILGSFFLDQSIALKDAGADVSVVFAEMHSLRSFSLKNF